MIRVTVYKNKDGRYAGLKVYGHAGYAEYGNDIICAGVSALVLNTVNSIQMLTDDKIRVKTEEESGLVAFKFRDGVSEKSQLLMDSLVLGIKGIITETNNSNREYIKFIFREV